MPHFTRTFTRGMPLVELIVAPSHKRLVVLQQSGATGPIPQRIQALIDTGASDTMLHPSVFATLRIPPATTSALRTASTGPVATRVNAYDVSAVLCGAHGAADGLILPYLRVTECDIHPEEGFQALIGRDILSHCVLTYNGTEGWITVAY